MTSKARHEVEAKFVRGGLAIKESHSYDDAKWGLVTVTNEMLVRSPRRAIVAALRRLGFVKAKP